VLRPGGGKGVKQPSKEASEKEKEVSEETEVKAPINFNNIALLLPFQLDRVIDSLPNRTDVERAGLALDFYQGFKLGLNRLAVQGDNFKLHVLDTRDNVAEVQRIAADKEVAESQLVIGPIFPTEINAFSSTANLAGKLQISPLAASSPSRYQVNNLVTVTPPIEVHARLISKHLAAKYGAGDQVIIFTNQDEDSKKLLDPLKIALDKLHVIYKEVEELGDIEMSLGASGKNVLINASTNQYFVAPLIASLFRLKTEAGYDISLIGHPNWTKLDLNPDYLLELNTCVSSSYYIDEGNGEVKDFRNNYFSSFKVPPSEFAYKGYDTGLFFGRLLAKYPKGYAEQLVKEKHKGISIGFEFVHDSASGYVNNSVRLLRFDGKGYRPL